MNRYHFSSRLFLLLLTLGLGQIASFGQYYPPAVWNSNNSYLLSGGGGSYSGGYYYTYTYDVVTEDGYWDYTSYGHSEYQDQGYWDNSPGHYEYQWVWDNSQGYYDADGNWVPQPALVYSYVWVADPPVWVSNPVIVWVNDPTWIQTGHTTNTYTGTAYVSASLSIDGNGNASMSAYDNYTGSTSYWNGSYGFYTGAFSGDIPASTAVNANGSSWTAPPPPPNYASYGPPALWVEGGAYAWAYTTFNDPYQTSGGIDYYSDGASHTVSFQSGSNAVSGTAPSGTSWSGTATNGIIENTSGIDVRFADSSGNYLRGTAPEGMPPAIRVDGSSALWNYIGQGNSGLHCYAGGGSGQRLTIDPSSGVVTILNDSNSALYSHSVIWTPAGGRDVRAVALDGSRAPNDQSPSWGPYAVLVNQAVWSYVGTWDGSVSFPGSPAPLAGDHYLGVNASQRLVVDASGNVTVFGMGDPVSGTYAPQSEQAGAPKVFTVAGYDIYPGDANGAYFKYQPSVGPPAVWVNGTTYAFANSKENATQPGVWTDTYVDGNNNYITVSAAEVIAFQADGSSNWSGYFVPADSNLGDGGIFGVVNGSPRYDVRASSGVTLLPPQGSPLNGHPSVVKVDGVAWNFGGSTTDTDYYFGASPGQRLWIDATGAVSFTNTVNSPNLAGAGNFSGSIFMVSGHDLRACTSDGLPVAPVGTPQWGPAALWVEGAVWNFIGSVSDNALNVHADYYGGMNAGQVVSVNSAMQVAGAHAGLYDGGVFVVTDGADLRALDATGAQIPPVGSPVNGYPTSLRIGGLHWNFIGTSNGQDYYATALGGQRLSIDANGAVVYSDHLHQVSGATGTYAEGVFTSTGGGQSFNAGTLSNDLDILGNVVSFGSLTGNAQTAGVTLQFMDDGSIATLQSALGRPQARWSWNRAATDGSSTALPVMQVDEQGRLNLYDPATAATPQVAPTVSLAPSVQAGVQTSKLPKLELSNQTLDTDNSVVTKTLGDERYLRASGANQSLALTTGINVNTGSAGSSNTVPANAAAIGQNLQASSGQVVVGRNNTAASNEVFVVGAGASPSQTKNALSVSDSGDTTVAGNLAVTGETTLADATVSGTLTVAGSPVLTQGSGTAAYLTSGQMEASYLKSADAATTYLSSTAAASQFLPVTADTVSVGVGNAVGPAGIGIGGGANAGAYAVAIGSLAGNNGAPPNNYPASGDFSVSLGRAARAPGLKAIAQGWYNWAEGESSIALGSGSVTRERGGIALGESTESNQIGQVVIGTFNQLTTRSNTRADGDSIFVVGNGTAEDARSNAFVIKRNGDTQIFGTLKVNNQEVLTQADKASFVSPSASSVSMGSDALADSGAWAIGNGALAGPNAISIGDYSGNNGWYHADGSIFKASGDSSVSVGYGSHGYGPHSVAVGFWNWAQGDDAISLGYESQAGSNCSVAIGKMAQATRWGQVVLGSFNELSTSNSDGGWANNNPLPTDDLFIVGNGTADDARSNAFVIKRNGDAEISGSLKINGTITSTGTGGGNSIGMGIGVHTGEGAVSIGSFAGNNGGLDNPSWFSGQGAVAVGLKAIAGGDKAVTLGTWTWADGESSIALGTNSTTRQRGGVAIGEGTESNQLGQVVIGSFNVLTTGTSTRADDDSIFVIGNGTADEARSNAFVIKRNGDVLVSGSLKVNGSTVLTQGSDTNAYLTSGQIDSTYLKASAAASTYLTSTAAASQFLPVTANTVSIGVGTTVRTDGIGIGESANAGYYAVSLGYFAGSNGSESPASGFASVAIGYQARSPGDKSITLGMGTWAGGARSIALGYGSATSQEGSIAIGEGTQANQIGQVVLGAFNALTTESGVPADGDSIFVIGNGTAGDARSNAFVIKRNGDVAVSGTLNVNGHPAATQADVDQKIQTERTASDAAYYRVNQPLVVPNSTTLNGSLTAAQSSRFQASFVVEGQTDPADATSRTVIAKPNQEILVPEQGDISMGEFRNGSLPVSQ